MSEAQTRMALFGDRADPLTRYKAEAEQAIEQEGHARSHGVEASQFVTLTREVVRLNGRIDAQNAEIAELRADAARAIERTANETIEMIAARVTNHIEAAVAKSEAKLFREVASKFGETIGRIAAIDPAAARAKSSERVTPFKFASERSPDDTVAELASVRALGDLH
jgi:hypothetical protein